MSKAYTFDKLVNIHIIDESEILNESTLKNIDVAENQLIRLYAHLLKWCFWKFTRCTNWINTIYDSVDSLCEGLVYYGIGSNRKPISEKIFLDAYNEGLESAIAESKQPEIFTDNLLEKYPYLMDIEKIVKPENIDKILTDYTIPTDYRYRELIQWMEVGYNNCLDKVNKTKYKGKYKE